MSENTTITVAYGDGIGPEIMSATLDIIKAAGAMIDIEVIEIGEKVYLKGIAEGIEPSSWQSLLKTKVFLKAPITTPQGGGFKSLNVATRKTLGLYANVRPCVSYHPYIETKHPVMDVVIMRENEEDLYAGIEYRQTDQVMQGLKLITSPGSEKIIRYAFEYARSNGRKKVTCFMKDNIMKITDGLFHKLYDKIGEEYPGIEKETWIVDIGAAKLATSPESFDVIVMENLYGDILSDVTAQMTGSVGLAGSANIGDKCAMFEAIHGSAPRRAGQNLANPSGLLLGAVMMLAHINQSEIASKVHNAWLKTLEDGVHTYDIYRDGISKKKVGTKQFSGAVIERLGKKPETLKTVNYKDFDVKTYPHYDYRNITPAKKELTGVDIFLHWREGSAKELGEKLKNISVEGLKLTGISNRGVKIWPGGLEETFCVDHWRCRFEGNAVTFDMIISQLEKFKNEGYDFIKTENLYTFDGEKGYSA
ncbi:MAG: NADP-dependent isocitrate dehydrogenase [Chlorobi bacterium]|nr:NADP-dependent isocitrate dehydrogenase [Chlorobiota bacterium]MCI0715213.1 NADP-dependent isocitrate dehydrogenase [Chlorobiota bacterium]